MCNTEKRNKNADDRLWRLPKHRSDLPSGGSGDVRRPMYVHTAFGVRAYGVRRTCVQRSAYVIGRGGRDEETGIKSMTQRRFPAEKVQTFLTNTAAFCSERTIPPCISSGILQERMKSKEAYGSINNVMRSAQIYR